MTCKICDKKCTGEYCFAHKPRKPLKTNKPMNKIGKVTKTWLKTRQDWFKLHPAEFYYCYICGKRLERNETQLDHVKSRSHHPELRYTYDNLKPCCAACNAAKGSKDYDER